MFYYIGGLFLSLFIALVIKKFLGFESKKALKMFISILPLTLISAFRYDVGWDYIGIYTNGFYYIGKYNLTWFSEVPFRYLVKILYLIFHNPISLFILVSFLTAYIFSLNYKVYGNSKKPFQYIILYLITRYYCCSLNIIRQALAIMIILYALHFLQEKKYLKYALCIGLAMSTHLLSVIYIPLGFFLNKNFANKKNMAIFIILIPIILMTVVLFLLKSKYFMYIESMYAVDGTLNYSELLICMVILLSSFIVYKKGVTKNNMFNIFFNMELIVLMISLISSIVPVVDRIIWYFSMQNIFFIPMILEQYEDKKNRAIFTGIIYMSLILVFCMQTIYSDSYAILPYQSIFKH